MVGGLYVTSIVFDDNATVKNIYSKNGLISSIKSFLLVKSVHFSNNTRVLSICRFKIMYYSDKASINVMTNRLQPQFTEILALIRTAQDYVIATSNQQLIKLYWNIGKYISERLKTSDWGQKTIEQLAIFIQTQEPGIKGFELRNLYRMRQFYETYPNAEIVSALLTQLNWTHHSILMSRCKTEAERLLEFYLEALDRDVKKPHENPSIGVLLCRDEDDEVVEYALSRSLSPTIVAEYEIKLIHKETLRRKLNEFYELLSDRVK